MANAGAQKFSAWKYEDAIRRHGRKVKWQESVTCSCINLDSGQAQYECQACHGLGYILSAPIEDLALISSITHNKQFEEMAGVFEVGDATMTVGRRVPNENPTTGKIDLINPGRENPIFHVGMYDLITLTDDVYKTSEVLTKNTPIYGRPADTLLNEDVVSIRKVQKADPQTGAITVFEEDTDYELDGNKIVWLGLIHPIADGEQYTVQYTHRPVFIVLTNLPTPRYQDGQDLPKSVALRYRAGGLTKS